MPDVLVRLRRGKTADEIERKLLAAKDFEKERKKIKTKQKFGQLNGGEERVVVGAEKGEDEQQEAEIGKEKKSTEEKKW